MGIKILHISPLINSFLVSETNDIEEIPECSFPINLKLFQKYQWLEPSLMAKLKK